MLELKLQRKRETVPECNGLQEKKRQREGEKERARRGKGESERESERESGHLVWQKQAHLQDVGARASLS